MGWLSQPLASPRLAKPPTAGGGKRPLIHAEEGVVTVKIKEASLDEVLREISTQSRIRLFPHRSRQEKITAEFQSVPLDQALDRLVKENFLLLYSPNGQLAGIVILSIRDTLPSFTPPAREPIQRILLRESAAFDSLILELHRGDAEQRGRAVLTLGELKDERALEPVIWALEGDEDPDVRRDAIWALEDLGGQIAIAALVEAVSRDSDESVRQRAVEALAEIGGHESVDPLTRVLMQDTDSFVRYRPW